MQNGENLPTFNISIKFESKSKDNRFDMSKFLLQLFSNKDGHNKILSDCGESQKFV